MGVVLEPDHQLGRLDIDAEPVVVVLVYKLSPMKVTAAPKQVDQRVRVWELVNRELFEDRHSLSSLFSSQFEKTPLFRIDCAFASTVYCDPAWKMKRIS